MLKSLIGKRDIHYFCNCFPLLPSSSLKARFKMVSFDIVQCNIHYNVILTSQFSKSQRFCPKYFYAFGSYLDTPCEFISATSLKYYKILNVLTCGDSSQQTLCDKCPYSELLWSVFSHIRTGYGKILRISPYSVQMRENMDQNNSEYGHFLRSGK